METINLSGMIKEIEYLKKCESKLKEVFDLLGSCDKKINGEEVGRLCRDVYELLYGFDDNE